MRKEFRWKKVMAALLTVSMLGQNCAITSAEGGAEITQGAEVQQEETQSAETQSAETQSTETQSTETQSAETQSAETQSAETQSAETQSTDTQSTDTQIEGETAFSSSDDEKTGKETNPVESDLSQTSSEETDADNSEDNSSSNTANSSNIDQPADSITSEISTQPSTATVDESTGSDQANGETANQDSDIEDETSALLVPQIGEDLIAVQNASAYSVLIRKLDKNNNVIEETQSTVNSGEIAKNVPKLEGYYFENATVSNVVIAYAADIDGTVYYSVDADSRVGSLLNSEETGSDEIVLTYRQLTNEVNASVTTSGYDNVNGNYVSGFPETAVKGDSFTFKANTVRGYTTEVTTSSNITVKKGDSNTYTVEVPADISETEITLDVEFKRTAEVTFDPGVFNNKKYVYLNGRFTSNDLAIQSKEVGEDGADFTFTFTTAGGVNWQIDSMQVNGVYLALPEPRDVGSSASTVISQDAGGACVATLSITGKTTGSVIYYTYELSITGAKSNITITEANLNNVTWAEVIPAATEGIIFKADNGNGLNLPTQTMNKTPTYTFSLKDGYKNLTVLLNAYKADGSEVTISSNAPELPAEGQSTQVTCGKTVLATLNNVGNGAYQIVFSQNISSVATLQLLKLSCTKKNYKLIYNTGDGSGNIEDSQSYDSLENNMAVVTSQKPTAPEGKFFVGWTLGNSSAAYFAGSSIDFSDSEIQALLTEDSDSDGALQLNAVYADELNNGDPVQVSVNIYKQGVDGKYALTKESYAIKAIMGKKIRVYDAAAHADGLHKYNKGKSTESITVDGKKSINLYYTREFRGTVSLADWTYGDTAAQETSSVNGGDYGQPEYWYKKVGEDDSKYTTAKPVNAGYYAVKAVWAATENCGEVTADDTFTIGKRAVSLTSASGSKVYDGQPLTNSQVMIGENGFAENEGAEFDVTGSQTLVGFSSNTFTYTLKKNTNPDNYNITKFEGTLTVTSRAAKYEITVKANSGSFKYDGSEKTVSGLEAVTFVVDGQTYTVSGLAAEKKAVDAGSYKVNIKGTAKVTDKNGNDVTAEFSINTLPGTMTISKRTVIMTSATASKEYDGQPLTKHSVEVTGDGFVQDEGATYRFAGAQTIVGDSKNIFGYVLNEGTNEKNYELRTAFGTLSVYDRSAKYEITLTARSDSFIYNGSQQSVSGFAATEFVQNGKTYTVSGVEASAAGTDAGKYKTVITGTPVVKDSDGHDVTNQFKVNVVPGMLTITTRSLVFTSAADSKEYDGKPLTNSHITIGGDGFADGEGADFKVTGSQTLVGSSRNTFTYTLKNGAKAGNYNISQIEGILTVTNRDAKYQITVEANSGTVKYDGTRQTVSGLKSSTFEIEGKTYTVSGLTAEGSGRDAGEYGVDITGTAIVTDADGNDVTAQFAVKAVGGLLTITRRDVVMISGTASKVYDGNALTDTDITISGDGFVQGEGAGYQVTGSQTLVGSSKNTFLYKLDEGTRANNYNILKTEGTLSIYDRTAKYQITLVANNVTERYDGTEKTNTGFKTRTFEINGNTYTVLGLKSEAKGTDAGKYYTTITGTPVVCDAAGNDVSRQFLVTAVPGVLTITTREITLISASDSKEYDGEPLTNDQVTVGGDGFAQGEGAQYDVTGSQTLVGTSANTFSYTLEKGTKAGNYHVTKEEGDLTVTNRNARYVLYAEANSGTFKYDGTEKTVAGLKGVILDTGEENLEPESMEFELEGKTYTVEGLTAVGSGTDAGQYTVNVIGAAVILDQNGNDVSDQFTVIPVAGIMNIEKRNIIMTSATASKVYDGTALTDSTVTVTGDGFAQGEGAAYKVTGSQTLVGHSENSFMYKLNENTKADNYNISKETGILMVYDRDVKYELSLIANSDTVKYNGKEQSVSGFESMTAEIDGLTYTVSGLATSASGTDAGSYLTTLTGDPVVTDEAGNDVTAQFQIHVTPGTLIIEPRELTFTSGSARKQYDGISLTCDDVTVEGEGFADGEGVDFTVTGSQTFVGESENTFTWNLKKGTLDFNYVITAKTGQLTVTDSDGQGVVTKTHEDKQYGLGDKVTFQITVKNIFDQAQSIHIQELPGVIITGQAAFENVAPGETVTTTAVYRITETDVRNGHFTNIATAVFANGKTYTATDTVTTKDSEKEPEAQTNRIIVTKHTVSADEYSIILDGASFYVALFADESLTQRISDVRSITFGKNQSRSSVEFQGLEPGDYYVAETDAEGNILQSGAFENGVFMPEYIQGNQVSFSGTGETAQFAFNNQFVTLPDGYYISGQLTVTKSVLDKDGQAMNSGETFYAGIFADPDYTTLSDAVLQNIIPLEMNGSSSSSQTVEVAVPHTGEAITLYVTEVLEDGTPVNNSENFGYKLEVQGGEAAFSQAAPNAAVQLINTQNENKPDDNKPDDNDKPDKDKNHGNKKPGKADEKKPDENTKQNNDEQTVTSQTGGVKTGDNSPIGLNMILLLCAIAAAAAVMAERKRRNHRGHI